MSTIRQQKAVRKISDFIRNSNGESINMGKILKEVGYSDSVCKKPQLIVNSSAFQELLQEELGDLDILVKTQHLFLINQRENLPVKAKAIDMYYKLTGKYEPVRIEATQDQEIKAALDRLGKMIT